MIYNISEKTRRLLSTAVGVAICVLLAAIASALFKDKPFVPLMFIGVVVFVAWVFGSNAGILGAIGAAMVFAHSFSPAGSFRIASEAARMNLEWLLLVGIPASYLLIPEKHGILFLHRSNVRS